MLVKAFANTKCHDPRDKVYTFLGLLNPDLKGHTVQADYAMTSVDLYFDVLGILEMEDAAPRAQPFGQVLQVSMGLAADEPRIFLATKRCKKKQSSHSCHQALLLCEMISWSQISQPVWRQRRFQFGGT